MSPFHLVGYLLLGAGLALLGAGAWGFAWLRRRREERALPRSRRRDGRVSARHYPAWRAGEDLLRYPDRLAQLEARLVTSHGAAVDQADHLRSRGEKVASKEGRGELAERYASDAAALLARTASMRRVTGLVWRTRAVLLIRAHVAITARARPRLEHMPAGDIPVAQLDGAAATYESAASDVRGFVVHVEGRLADLSVTIPGAPPVAELTAEDRELVRDEKERARATYIDLQNRMDRLADTLAYLADRCRTRQVVEAARVGVDGAPGTADLMDEVGEALRALEGLTELGDQQLADTAMDNLAEDISQLEQAGLEAQAEADAALEVNRLLDQFPA
ncbi:MAG: hypothetical protein VX000_17920 [Myxococcota bacterium]|nr:hypothetical protein [Myxococcota bacterium]